MIQAKDDEEASAPSNIESDDGSHRPATKSPEVIFKEVVGYAVLQSLRTLRGPNVDF